MKPLMHGWRYGALCSLLAALPVYVACTQPPPTDSSAGADSTGDDLSIVFTKMYSACDGTHDMKIPAKVDGVKGLKWSADPADAVDSFDPGDTTGEVIIVLSKKCGDPNTQTNVTITAKKGSLKATAPLTITNTTPDVWSEGDQRYNDGVQFSWGGGEGGHHDHGDGGDGPRQHPPPDPHLACTNCHNKGGGEGNDVEHTPTQTGGYSDDDLKNIITNATKPNGDDGKPIPQRIMPIEQWQKIHKWEMDPQQLTGIIAYLRSLEPKSQGPVDFPGMHGGHDKGGSSSKSPSSSSSPSKSSSPN